jgi:F-type H+-transporting ATPase subunit b
MIPAFFAEGMIAGTARQFGVDWPHFIAQVFSFSIVAFLLHRLAYKPILHVLAERKQRIAEGLSNSDRIKAELAKTEAARQEVMRKADEHANKLIEEARAVAACVQEQETQKALSAAQSIIAKAKEEAAQIYTRSLAELKREIGHLVIDTTGKVTGKVLTPADQQKLAEETAKQIAA